MDKARSIPELLFDKISPASIGLFRVALGIILGIHIFEQITLIPDKFIRPEFFFSYPHLEWVRPWPGTGMYIHYIILFLCAAFIACGIGYRIAAVLFFIGYGYTLLIDVSYYKNHYYLFLLITGIMCLIPADQKFSLIRSIPYGSIRRIHLWLLRFQFCVVYFFAGIAKLNLDWFRGEPLRGLIKTLPLPALQILIYGGLIFDLTIAFALLWRKTRMLAAVLAVIFHVANLLLFHKILPFPLLMIASLILFFDPEWPNKFFPSHSEHHVSKTHENKNRRALILGATAVYIVLQITIPLRHLVFPGNIMWTSEGERWSWRMVTKRVYGQTSFRVQDSRTGKEYTTDPQRELNQRQFLLLMTTPEMILRYAHHLGDKFKRVGVYEPRVFADSFLALNGRELRRLIDPTVDLSGIPLYGTRMSDIVLPYHP